jgi:hypothetical protein
MEMMQRIHAVRRELAIEIECERFDATLEGRRHGLSRELAQAIWKRVCADGTDGFGRRDEDDVRRRFHALAARIASRGGRPHGDPRQIARVTAEITGDAIAWVVDDGAGGTPGRGAAARDTRRWARPDATGTTGMHGAPRATRASRAVIAARARSAEPAPAADPVVPAEPGGPVPDADWAVLLDRARARARLAAGGDGGAPLPGALRRRLERHFEVDLGDARVHIEPIAEIAAPAVEVPSGGPV